MPRETFYDEIEIEDFTWDSEANLYHYPCPCGDRFEITKSQLRDGDEVARCPSCSLIIRVIYEWVSWGLMDLSHDAKTESRVMAQPQDDYEDYDSAEEQDGEEANEETQQEQEPGGQAKESTTSDALARDLANVKLNDGKDNVGGVEKDDTTGSAAVIA